ncbi:MAG: ArsR family transcriptional regulator [Candidatus Thiodiazotropha sp. (ex Myrtea spinifera)]|nr:ArsR family transcriptional regulator [Candidatus Thiodiazotropha sp. (ex Myrtea spinifera)]
MFKLLEKWVNEHGSANIMEKRLGLKEDEIAAVHRELTSLMSEHSQLQSENEQLKASLKTAEQEIKRLNEIINSSAESQSSNELDEVKANILKTLFKTNSHASISQLSSHLGIEGSLVQYHIDGLKENDLIAYGPLMVNSPATYRLSNNGRKYVVEEIGI